MVADRIDLLAITIMQPNISPLTHYVPVALALATARIANLGFLGINQSTNGRRGRSIFGYGICFVSLLH